MYNSATETKIKEIPSIGSIDTERLPQELTRIFALIISFRRQIVENSESFINAEFSESLGLLQSLANNLETILICTPNHEKKESIAFVAGTAHCHLCDSSLNARRQTTA